MWQDLVLDLDGADRVVRLLLGLGGHRGDVVALVAKGRPGSGDGRTALTPGIFSAAAGSIDLILAWACGLYSITANKVPSGRASLGYLARPDALARPSSLVILVPIKRGFSGQVGPWL